jgi:hypothetical protein
MSGTFIAGRSGFAVYIFPHPMKKPAEIRRAR